MPGGVKDEPSLAVGVGRMFSYYSKIDGLPTRINVIC